MESDFWYDFTFSRWQPWRPPACSSVRRLPASTPNACDVIGSLYALQFLIHSAFVLVSWMEQHLERKYMKELQEKAMRRPSASFSMLRNNKQATNKRPIRSVHRERSPRGIDGQTPRVPPMMEGGYWWDGHTVWCWHFYSVRQLRE